MTVSHVRTQKHKNADFCPEQFPRTGRRVPHSRHQSARLVAKGSSFTNDNAREKDKSHIHYRPRWDMFCLFGCEPYAFPNYWFLELVLDELYSVEHLKCRRFFAVRLSVISRKI